MPGPYEEEVDNQFDYETDWLEAAEDTEPFGAQFADTSQQDTLFGFVRWEKRRAALRFFKGFAEPWEIEGPPGGDPVHRLHREQPHRHPDYPWLRAFDVTFKGLRTKSNSSNPNFEPYDITPFTVDVETRRTKYEWALCTVKYRAFGDMWFLSDEDVGDGENEWFRNTLFMPPEPTVEALTVSGGLSQLTFSEGTGLPQPTAGTTKFGAPLPELQTKVGFRLLWQHVPWEWLSSSNNYFFPQKIIDCIGRVNCDTFLDEFEPETLMMMPPSFELFPWWVASDDVTEPLIGVNVYLNFSWFDPPTGITPPYRKGWNNMPWSGDGAGVGLGSAIGGDGKYYRATRTGQNAGRALLEAVPFRPMFTHVEDSDDAFECDS